MAAQSDLDLGNVCPHVKFFVTFLRQFLSSFCSVSCWGGQFHRGVCQEPWQNILKDEQCHLLSLYVMADLSLLPFSLYAFPFKKLKLSCMCNINKESVIIKNLKG